MPEARNLLDYVRDPTCELPEPLTSAAAAQAILEILDRPEREGGATYSLRFGDQFGEPFFAVAVDNRLTDCLIDRDQLAASVASFLQRHRELLLHPRCSVGSWEGTDAEGVHLLFLDITMLAHDEAVALNLGRDGNQIAIFDLQRGVEIDTGGTGLPVGDARMPLDLLRQLDAIDSVESKP